MTAVPFKRPSRPTDAQLRLLDLVHQRLSHLCECTALSVSPLFKDPYEEDELLGEIASFAVHVGDFELTLRTPLPWDDLPEERVSIGFAPYRGATQAVPWALIRDRAVRRALSRLGFSGESWCEASWMLAAEPEAAHVEAITRVVEELGALDVRTVRPQSLLAGERFPSFAAVLVVEADRILSITSDTQHWHVVVERDEQEMRVGILLAELPWVERLRGLPIVARDLTAFDQTVLTRIAAGSTEELDH